MLTSRKKYLVFFVIFCFILTLYYFLSVSYIFVNIKNPQETLVRKFYRPYILKEEKLFLPIMKQIELYPFLGIYRKRQRWDNNAINIFLREYPECIQYFPASNILPSIFTDEGKR